MPFTATCPSCDTAQRLGRELRGKKVACPECGERYVARPSLRKPANDLTLMYVVLGVVGLVAVGGGLLVFLLTSRKSADAPIASAPPPDAAPAPTVPFKPPAPAPAAGQPAPAEKAIVLTSDALRQEFAKDESGADRKYKDRTLEVTGTLTNILHEPPLRGLCFGGLQDPVAALLCDMAPDQAAVVAQLKPGQTVTVRGVCRGRADGTFIGMSKCEVVPR